jgi:putative protease
MSQLGSTHSPAIELLAPAGDRECLQAAVENGADAVYFGLDRGYNARARATNFCLETLADVMDQLHQRQVRGYVTLNTLVFSDELAEFEAIVREVAQAGVDAVLVQDFGAARLIREVCPDLSIHASTQMTLTSAECIAAVRSLGVQRVVLPRELSIREIRDVARHSDVSLEVFVHGALCVAYSGQCLTSESLGGRSANRGQCAQACRLPYELYRDGEHVDLGRQKHLLSPLDLAAYDLVPELIAAGAAALKIEGRLKSPEYVAGITSHYRRAIDASMSGTVAPITQQQRDEMELTFSRGFAPGWLEGCDHKRLVPGVSSAKRGLLVGTVQAVRGQRVCVRLVRRVQAGDGLMFDCGRAQNQQPGGRIFEIWQGSKQIRGPVADGSVELSFQHAKQWLQELQPGQSVWKTDDPGLMKRLRRTFQTADPLRRLNVAMHVQAHVGQPLRVTATLGSGTTVSVASDEPLHKALRHEADERLFRTQLDRLGHTPLRLGQLTCDLQGLPMVPMSVIGRVRRELVQQLTEQLARRPVRRIRAGTALPELRGSFSGSPGDDRRPRLHVLCRSLGQLEIALNAGVTDVSIELSDIRKYGDAVSVARSHQAILSLATPRIFKPGETGIFASMLRQRPDAVLVRNLAALRYFCDRGVPVIADYALNVANELSAQFIRQSGAKRVTVSYDLNRDQLLQLVRSAPASWLEVVVHQHMPMFHMEHCVFCSVLSPGTDKTNCGRPCDRHVVQLEDRIGMKHPLTADVGCRNTLFNAQPQSAAEIVPELMAAGIIWLRIELLEQTSEPASRQTIALYQQLVQGTISGRQVWSRLQAVNRVGLTRGTLEANRDPLAIL